MIVKKIKLLLFAIPLFALNISTTILPQKYIIKEIAKDKINVTVMVPPGNSPATYSPTIKELKKLKNSIIYFYIGVPFDKKYLSKIKEINPNIKLIDFGALIKKEKNPHIWLSPALLMLQAKVVLNTLIKIDQANKEFYINNYIQLIQKLSELEKEGFTVTQKSFLTFHPSFYYFAKDFNLNEIALEKEGKAPSFSYLAKVLKIAKKENIKTVFISPEFPTKYAKLIAKKIKAKVVVVSPLEDPLKSIKKLIKALK